MKVNQPVSEYKKFLHHRAPMVWVDRVVEAGKNDIGLYGACRVLLNSGRLFLSDNKKVRGSAAVEFIAQTYGYVRACYQQQNNITYRGKRTLLTGIRNCTSRFSQKEIDENEELHIEIQTVRELQPLIFVRGQVFNSDKTEEYASAEIQIYVGD